MSGLGSTPRWVTPKRHNPLSFKVLGEISRPRTSTNSEKFNVIVFKNSTAKRLICPPSVILERLASQRCPNCPRKSPQLRRCSLWNPNVALRNHHNQQQKHYTHQPPPTPPLFKDVYQSTTASLFSCDQHHFAFIYSNFRLCSVHPGCWLYLQMQYLFSYSHVVTKDVADQL